MCIRDSTNILEVLKLEAQVPDFPPEQDRIHVFNGTLLLNGTFTAVSYTHLDVYKRQENILSVHHDRAACRAIQPAQHVQLRGFAGAGCADNCNKFALLYT